MFGFLRFYDVKNTRRTKMKLDNIRLESFKVHVIFQSIDWRRNKIINNHTGETRNKIIKNQIGGERRQ